MKVLAIPDSFGWAYDFYARGYKTYSKHEITICPGYPKDNLTRELVNAHDVIFCFSRTIWNALREDIRHLFGSKPLIMWCCGSSFATPPPCVDRYAVCTKRLVKQSKKIGIKNPVLLREGVDTAVYKPLQKKSSDVLRVGWAGNPGNKLKRIRLLKQLQYPVRIMGQHDLKYRIKNRSRQPMVDFYNSIDVYITLMKEGKAHGVGKTILEAMSCKLPVVSTDICSTSKAVGKRWLVPELERLAVKQANKRLKILDDDRKLLEKVGKRNRRFILAHYAWETVAKEWDQLFEEVSIIR